MKLRFGLAAMALAVLALAGCGGSGEDPFRVGVVVDCVGINRSLREAELGGAELPLIERGAEPGKAATGDDSGAVPIAGRRVELVPGCTEVWEFNALIEAVRTLVEDEHVDAIVAAGSGADEVVLAKVARLYEDVPVLAAVHGPREVTLNDPPANLYRFAGDWGQGVAGLGTYAYRSLGWRRASVVLFNWDSGWGARSAFVGEFCALGGNIESQIEVEGFDPAGADVAKVPRDVDGVAVFAPAITDPGGFLRRIAGRYHDPSRHLLVGPMVVGDPTLLRTTRRALTGVSGSSFNDPGRLRAYLRAYARAFPGIPAEVAGSELVTGYHDAVKALLAGLEAADGRGSRLPAALDDLRVSLLGGPVHLDDNRQAVISTSLVRIAPPAEPAPGLRLERTVPEVDQSVGGVLDRTHVPAAVSARCPHPDR